MMVPVTTLDQVVDHKWSIGVPRFGWYIWVSKGVIFRGKHFGGGAEQDARDQ